MPVDAPQDPPPPRTGQPESEPVPGKGRESGSGGGRESGSGGTSAEALGGTSAATHKSGLAPGGEPAPESELPREGGLEPEVLPATAARPRPRAAVAVRRRGAGPLVRDTVARLARNPVAVTTALVGAGLAARLAPAVLGREVLRAAPAALPAALPAVRAATEPAVVRHVVHHHVVHHHVVRQVVQVVVHVRPSPPPGIL
jgi:hypothetical protein